MRITREVLLTCQVFLFFFVLSSTSLALTGPSQPVSGPGGNDYPHASVTITKYGTDIYDMYWINEPAAPTPAEAPVIVFYHGTSSQMNPDDVPSGTRDWVDHLVKKGFIVVFPLYQYGAVTLGAAAQIENAANVVEMAFNQLMSGAHVSPILNGSGRIRYANVGHSRGGGMAFNMGRCLKTGIDPPEAIHGSAPGALDASSSSSCNPLPSTTLVVLSGGEDDAVNGPLSGSDNHTVQWNSLTGIPDENKNKWLLHTQDRGAETVEGIGPWTADHGYTKTGGTETNAQDYYGSWKASTGIASCALKNQQYCNYVLGNGNDVTYMGTWSDLTELEHMTVTATSPWGNPGNNPPVFNVDPIVKANATVDIPYSGESLNGSASDLDSDPLTYGKVNGPGWLTIAPDGDLGGTPSIGDQGLNTWTVSVSDGQGGYDQADLEILVEDDPGGSPDVLLWDDFEDFNTEGWNTDWATDTNRYVSASHSVRARRTTNDLVSRSLDTAGYSSITVSFWYRIDDIDANDNVRLQFWDGSSYVDIDEIGDDTESTWLEFNQTFTKAANPEYFSSDFMVKIEATSIDFYENLWVDDFKITGQP